MCCRCRRTSRADNYSGRNRLDRSERNVREYASSGNRSDMSRRLSNSLPLAAEGRFAAAEAVRSRRSTRTIHPRTGTSSRLHRSRRHFPADTETSEPQPAGRQPATATRPTPSGERRATTACQGFGRDQTAIALAATTRGNACALNQSNNGRWREIREVRKCWTGGSMLCRATHALKSSGQPHPRGY